MGEQKNQKTQDVNQLLKIRRDKLAELQADGKDPFQITKFDVHITARKSKISLRIWKERV